MKKYAHTQLFFTIFLLLCIPISASSSAKQIRLKFGTLAPKGTSATLGIEIINEGFEQLANIVGTRLKIVGYYGGIMGDDPQMLQKAKMGQLDFVSPTVNALPSCIKEFDALYMAYLLENYGQFDYFVTQNSSLINNLFYKNGWISITQIISEGVHNLYMDKPYRKPEELKKNLKATNYTGGPDDSFYKSFRISQVPIQPPEMFPAFKSRVSNAVILPSLFVIGMQIYTALPYIVDPPIRISTCAPMVTKRKYKQLPWDVRAYFAVSQPVLCFMVTGLMRDGAVAYTKAMYKYGSKNITLTESELKIWKDAVMSYRKTYIANHKAGLIVYNKMVKAIKEYKSGYPIERAIFERDETYLTFSKSCNKVAQAINTYCKTGSKTALAKLEKKKIFEKWRLYDMIIASEKYIKTGNPKMLKKWTNSFYISEIVDELFSKHLSAVKKLMGTKKSLVKLLKIYTSFLDSPKYTGFQKPVSK